MELNQPTSGGWARPASGKLLKDIKDSMEFMKNKPRDTGTLYPPPFSNDERLYRWMYQMNMSKQHILVSPSQFDGYVEWCKKTLA